MMHYQYSFEVEPASIDENGHVNNVEYVRWMQEAATAHATGMGSMAALEALDATWDEYQRETGKRRAKRDDITDANDFMGWYMTKTRDRTNVPLSDARNQYLAYHEGRSGYLRGSYNSKPWLLRIADEVQDRSQMYQQQLASCRVG